MKSSAKNINLTSVDDLFSTEESRIDENREKVQEIPLSELYTFKDHPFKVIDNEAMFDTAESVKQYGVLVPAIARPRDEGGYELVAGHRRKRACELAELTTMPVIVRNLDDNAATIIMVDSNIQRESLLPSERAFAYKLKLNAMKRQGARSDLTCAQLGHKLDGRKSRDILAEQVGESKNQISRYIRLTELTPALLDMVDEKKIAFNPAVELSYLKPDEQNLLLDAMDSEQATPSLSQAQRLKKYSQEGKLSLDVMTAIMSEEKKGELHKVYFYYFSETEKKYIEEHYPDDLFECRSVQDLWKSLDCITTKYNCNYAIPSEVDKFIECFNSLSGDTATKEQILKEISLTPQFEMDRLCHLVKADMLLRNPEHKPTDEAGFIKSSASISYIALQEGFLPSTLYMICVMNFNKTKD